MGIGKGSNTTTSSSTSSPDPQAYRLYSDLLNRAQQVSNTPYTPYTGELVAPVNQQQQLGISNINAGAGFALPNIQTALGYANEAAQPISASQIQQYMSPYTQNVVQATQNQFNNQNAQQQQQLLGNAISQGALGGNRVGVAQAELANQQNLAQAPVIANLMNQGYSSAVATALAEQQAKQAGAYSLGNLGLAGQSAALTGANAQIGAGTLQQQTQQAENASRYQQYMQQLGYPFQTAQWLAGIATGVGSQMGGTSTGTTTGPSPNPWSQALGLATTLGGFFFDKGGRVPEGVANYDTGGAVEPNSTGIGAMPYAGAKGWVPGIGITPGRLPPANFPKLQQQASPDLKALAEQGKTLGSLANSILSGLNGPPAGNSMTSGTGEFLGSAGDPTGGGLVETSAAQGGAVDLPYGLAGGPMNFADGGSPSDILFDPDLMGVAPSVGFKPEQPSSEVPPEVLPPPAPKPAGVAPSELPAAEPVAAGVAPPESTTLSARSLPRGLRNNNPGNIEDGDFARSQPGYKGSDGRFAIYETPEAGANAASNLLGAYSKRGINTISGIVNRWAPAADNNNVGAYVAAVSKATGFAPNQPLDMSDPAVRTKVADAMFSHENGVPNIEGTLAARNYNRAAGLNLDAAQGDAGTTELSAQTKRPSAGSLPFGIANLLDLSPTTKQALVSAGLGMLASRSPFLGTAIGEGGMQGLQTYQGLKQQEAAHTMKHSEIDLRAKQLALQADRFAKEHEVKMMPYSGAMTAKEKMDAAYRTAQLEEQRRQHNLSLKTPVKIGQTPRGQDLYALPKVGPNGEVEYWPIDPKTGRLGTSPLGGSLKDAAARTAPGAPQNAAPLLRHAALTEEEALASAPPQEIRAQQPIASAAARNETYLKYLAEAMGGGVDGAKYANLIKGIADYQINPNALFSLRGNNRQKALEDVLMYDPTYDQRRYAQTNRAISGWAQSPEGRSTRSLSVVIEHLATAEELGEALKNGDIQLLNRARNALKTQFGYEGPPNFEFAKQIVADEIAKAVIGGVNAEQDRRGLQEQLKAASSPEQLKGVIRVAKELMAGQVVGLKHTYETATGLHNFDKWLTPRAKEAIGTLMEERERKMQAGHRPPQPAGTGAPTLSANDQKALEWANANPSDPRAAAIKKKLGVP